jgi:hypothetical protein
VLKIAVTLQNLFEIVTRISHAVLELVHLVFNLLKSPERAQRRFVNCRSRFEVNVLGQKTELQRAGARDFTAIGCFITSYEPKDGRLAGAVATDKPHVLARINLQARATQHVLRAVGFVNVCETKQHLEFTDWSAGVSLARCLSCW